MERKCVQLPINEYIDLKLIDDKNVLLYIDTEKPKDSEEIYKLIKKNKKKFKIILTVVLSGKYNQHLYGRENVGGGTEDITAMKFSGEGNKRVYCKEFFQNGKKIVMITPLSKKGERNQDLKTLTNRLRILGGYKYDFK